MLAGYRAYTIFFLLVIRQRPAVADKSRYVGVLGESLEIVWTLGVKPSRFWTIDIFIHSPGERRRIFNANFSSGIPEVIKEPVAELQFLHGINATFTASSKFKVRIETVERLLENSRFSIGLYNFPGLLVFLNGATISVDVVNTGNVFNLHSLVSFEMSYLHKKLRQTQILFKIKLEFLVWHN